MSGYYVADLVFSDGLQAGAGTRIPFIVRSAPSRRAAILVDAPVNTWQAYNAWGGRSLYWHYDGTGRGANHVSFDRPYDQVNQGPWQLELPLVRFLEQGGYDVSYTTDVDIDADPSELLRHRLVIVAGHSEYWTKTMRDAFERARDAGVNLAFLGANDGYWQIRYGDNWRTVIEYRKAYLDSEPNPELKTTRFRVLDPPRPECALLGVQFYDGPPHGSLGSVHDYQATAAAATDTWFRGTGLVPGSVLHGLVGGEWDLVQPGCLTYPFTVLFHYQGPPANADAVTYTAPSGARVFSAGSFQFSWGLDPANNDGLRDPRLQQFMRNALADLTAPPSPNAACVLSPQCPSAATSSRARPRDDGR